MKSLYLPFSILGALTLPFLTSCDGSDPENEGFGFVNNRFDVTFLNANLAATASMPLFLVSGDEFQFVPAGPTTSFDEDFTPVMSRHGSTLTATGLNLVTFERYQDPTLQNRFPALQASWTAGEGSQTAVLTSADSIDQNEIDIFTRFAFNNAQSGGVFSNPFTDTNGDLDGDISSALEQAGLVDVTVSEAKGDLIETELQSLGKEIYNNADSDDHMHGGPPTYRDPALRATVRRVFRFTSTSTNADIIANSEITGTYQIVEQYQHLYTHAELADAPGYIRMVMRQDGFAGEEVIETGNYTLKLQN